MELGSTVVFDTLEAFEAAREARYENGTPYYGRYGNAATFSLEDLLAELDGANGVTLTSSGVSAITSTLLALATPGAHLLVAENLYGNTRSFCDGILAAMNVAIEPFDPMSGLNGKIRENTCAVMVEAPGSGTFEVCDMPQIARVAKESSVPVVFDNTWGLAGLLQTPGARCGRGRLFRIEASLRSFRRHDGCHRCKRAISRTHPKDRHAAR